MKVSSLAVLLIVLYLVSMLGSNAKAAEDLAASSAPEARAQAAPSLHFLRPVRGERFFDYPIFVEVDVTGFKLVPPDAHSKTPAPANTGHIDFSMDDYPVYATDDTQIMIGKRLGDNYLPVGLHVLKAQLMDVNDRPLDPPVVAVTEVFSGHPAVVETIQTKGGSQKAELTGHELYEMRVHLEELRKNLRKIEAGDPGYTPQAAPGTGKGGD